MSATQIYLILHHTHVTCVVVTISLFSVRWALRLIGIDHRRGRLLRRLPHVIDTVLLISAIGLTLVLSQYPLTHAWLTAKVLALLAYIVLGALALKPGQSRRGVLVFGIAAYLTFAYIVGAALSHSPMSWL